MARWGMRCPLWRCSGYHSWSCGTAWWIFPPCFEYQGVPGGTKKRPVFFWASPKKRETVFYYSIEAIWWSSCKMLFLPMFKDLIAWKMMEHAKHVWAQGWTSSPVLRDDDWLLEHFQRAQFVLMEGAWKTLNLLFWTVMCLIQWKTPVGGMGYIIMVTIHLWHNLGMVYDWIYHVWFCVTQHQWFCNCVCPHHGMNASQVLKWLQGCISDKDVYAQITSNCIISTSTTVFFCNIHFNVDILDI